MAQVKIYSAKVCPYAQRVRMVLLTKEIEFESIEIDLHNKPDWFAEVSPYGKVPVIQHGENRIWESGIINEYLEEVFPDPPLMPQNPGLKAITRIWIDFANTKFTPAFYKLLLSQDTQQQKTWRNELHQHLLFIENEGFRKLSGTDSYWLGDAISLIDLSFYPWFERWIALEHYRGLTLPAECTRLKAWLEIMRQHPAVQATAQSPEFYLQDYAQYANNQASGTTAEEMRRY
ncbi:MAG: glutathione S-transferase family protein [Acaryochloris sp. RU_4_1]|nr:glutathione S-transferase family protein [Acaryochloris sp. SU_5_25]NJM65303.1 glutathione S-transferase family protein [Acaryochloris sp. RU_4_1]NJR55176.1 glutathione S-transferase family protein [Acaryochloris sp. CRU_2_0]